MTEQTGSRPEGNADQTPDESPRPTQPQPSDLAPQQPDEIAGAPAAPPPPAETQPTAPQTPKPQQPAAPHAAAPQPPAPPAAPQPAAHAAAPQQPPAPYGGAAPQQPYGAYPAPQPPAPYAQGQYYASSGGQQPPYPPQPGQPYGAYPAAPQQPKRKVWPWVLGGCLVALVLGLGGCAGCVGCALYMDDRYGNLDNRGYSTFDYDYGYDYGYDGSGSLGSDPLGGFSLSDIQDAVGDLPGTVEDGVCSGGAFKIGEDIQPGHYYLEGAADAESSYYIFDYDAATDSYSIDDAVVYFGNYFVDLEEGDLMVFMPGNDALRMRPAERAEFDPAPPYENGLYRVGDNIPAGTYTITVSDQAAAAASGEPGAFVMKDLSFDDDSITESVYVIAGGSQTVTVQDGEWLELYAAVAVPQE